MTELLTLQESAARLRVSVRTVHRLVADGRLRVVKIGRRAAQAEKEAKRKAYYAQLESARKIRAEKASKPKRVARAAPERVQSPWPRKRRRKGRDVFDIATPEQLAIIRQVQNRGRAV